MDFGPLGRPGRSARIAHRGTAVQNIEGPGQCFYPGVRCTTVSVFDVS